MFQAQINIKGIGLNFVWPWMIEKVNVYEEMCDAKKGKR